MAKDETRVLKRSYEPYMIIGGFPDEFSYEALKHLEFFGKLGIPISIRFFTFSDDPRLQGLEDLTRQEFDKRTAQLKDEKVIKHITEASAQELALYVQLMGQHKVKACDIGSGLGKQYMDDPNFEDNWKNALAGVIKVAKRTGAKKVRGFGFYPGRQGDELESRPTKDRYGAYWDRSLKVNQEIAGELAKDGLFLCIEQEPQLLVHDGKTSTEYIQALGAKNVFAYHDGANATRLDDERIGLSLIVFKDMRPVLAGLHFKAALYSILAKGQDREEAAWPHVPVGQGDSQYNEIFKLLPTAIPEIRERLLKAGLKGDDAEAHGILEPHLLAQGRFGGYTGSKYIEALMAVIALLDRYDIRYQKINLKAA